MTNQQFNEVAAVTVSFLGGDLIPGLPKSVTIPLNQPVTMAALIDRLGALLGVRELRDQIARYYAILLDGTAIQHLQGWETMVHPGASVAVVAPLGGGSKPLDNR